MNTAARSEEERRSTQFDDLAVTFKLAKANGTIPAQRLVKVSAEEAVVATFNSPDVVGVNARNRAIADNEGNVLVGTGRRLVVADTAVTSSQKLKAGSAGRVLPLVDSTLSGTTIKSNAGLQFTNQPANDGVELVSSSALDVTQTATIWYTRTGGGNTVSTETKTITGTTQVVFTDVDVDNVLAVELSATCAGTVTFREASGNATIVALTTGVNSSGKIATTTPAAYNQAPTAVANIATVAVVGILGTDEDGAALLASIPLTGTTLVTFPDTFKTVTYLLLGVPTTATTVTVKVGAQDNTGICVGMSLDTATAQGDRINAILYPSMPARTFVTTTVRAGQEYQAGFGSYKAGTTAGWVVAAGANLYEATLPQSQTASTLVVPIVGLKVGWTITGFKSEAQIESAGGVVTLDADLRKLLNTAADPVDSSIGAITQVSVTADTASEAAKTGLSEVVTAGSRYYVLVTGTTAATTDVRFLGITVTVTET
jgi:hypothetical protein